MPSERDNAEPFGQADPTDGRRKYDWRSKYDDPMPRRAIRIEATYLALLLFGYPVVMAWGWLEYPNSYLALPPEKYRTLFRYALAWISGSLGGVLFALKWLYHSVARGTWHLDRRLWRLFTPHISGGLSFAMVALISSGALRIFDTKAMKVFPVIVGVGFLVGYFSDSAVAKLSDVADTLFGTVKSKEKHSVRAGSGSELGSDE